MREKLSKKLKTIFVAILTVSLTCALAVVITACGHVHSYDWKWDDNEHWMGCKCGEEKEGTREPHVFIAGECECGATETVGEKKYGSAHGQVKLRGLGGTYDTDYSDVTVDMGDEVDPDFNTQTGAFRVENVEVGKTYTLTVSKPDYQPYVVSVEVGENEDVEIGGSNGMVLQRNSFDTTLNWGKYNFSKANEETGEISVTNRHFMVLTKDTYNEVVFSVRLNGFKRPGGGVKKGLPLVDDAGNTIEQGIALAFGKDVLSIRMSGKSQVALWNTWLAGEWKGSNALTNVQEKILHSFTGDSQYLRDFDASKLTLTVHRKENKLAVFLNGTKVGDGEVAEKYKNAPCAVGIIAHNAVDDVSWKHWNFTVDGGDKAVTVTNNTASDAHGSLTGIPETPKFGDTVTIAVTPESNYKLAALLINGVDVKNDLNGNSYSFVLTKNTTIEAQFTAVTYGSVAAIVSGNAFGNISPLPQNTSVTLSANGFTDVSGNLDASGKLSISQVAAGEWTVAADGYLPAKITVADGAAYSAAIVLERDPFDTTVSWGTFDFLDANEEEARFGVSDGNFLILSNQQYDDVGVTMYLDGTGWQDGLQQGVAIAFVGNDSKKYVLTVRMQGKNKLALGNTWIATHEDWSGKGGNALTAAQENDELYIFDADGEYIDDFNRGTLALTVYRRQNDIIVCLNGTMVGRCTVNDEYKEEKCVIGFVGHETKAALKYWKFAVTTEIPSVTVTDGTAANAGGSITFTAPSAKIGDTVTITVTPNGTNMLASLTVSGGVTPVWKETGTYTFAATQTRHTVTATFVAKPSVEVSASVSAKNSIGTQVNVTDRTELVFTDALGKPTKLNVSSSGVKGTLLPGRYTVTANGYYATAATVTDSYAIMGAIQLQTLTFQTNAISDSANTYIQNAANANSQKIIVPADGKLYEWSREEYDDVAVSFTFKKMASGGVQGIAMRFADGKDVIVRIEQKGDNEFAKTKVQWGGGTFWGMTAINNNTWDFGTGTDYANPLSNTLLTKYVKNGIKLTLVRRGGTMYALIDGKIFSSQSVGNVANNKVKFAVFVEHAKKGMEIPFAIDTAAYAVLERAGNALDDSLTGFVGDWTKSGNVLTSSGAACYAQFDSVTGVYKESVTIHIRNRRTEDFNGDDDQGILYKFSDGSYMAIRYQYNSGNFKIQYTQDTTLFQGAYLKGWTDYAFEESEKTTFAQDGLDLTFIRNGNTFYILLGNRVVDTSTVDAKYAEDSGNMGIMIWNGRGDSFTYSHASGSAVTVPSATN